MNKEALSFSQILSAMPKLSRQELLALQSLAGCLLLSEKTSGARTASAGSKSKAKAKAGPRGPATQVSAHAGDPAYVELKAAQRAFAAFIKADGEFSVNKAMGFTPESVPERIANAPEYVRLDAGRTCWFRRKAEITTGRQAPTASACAEEKKED